MHFLYFMIFDFMDNNIDLENYNFATDIPDSRDFTHDEVYEESGMSWDIPSRVILDIAPGLNQGRLWACTVFGSSMAYNETFAQRAKEKYFQPYNPLDVWEEAKKIGASDKTWWLFQSALQLLRDLGHIGAYVRIDTAWGSNVDKMKSILASGKGIATGVKLADWTAIKKSQEWNHTTKNWGHIFAITGYDDEHVFSDWYKWGFYSPNSWDGVGKFWIRYADIRYFFSRYEFVLTEDLEKVIKARENRRTLYLQKAFDAKIWNETNPDQIATAREIATMFKRGLGYGDNRRMMVYVVAMHIDKYIIRGKWQSIQEIYDGKIIASDTIIADIFTKAVVRNLGISAPILSRKQVAEIIGRDFL